MADVNYYKITLSYEIPRNILDSQEEGIVVARDALYERLNEIIPEKYEKFSVRMTLYQTKDTLNYLVTYESYFRSLGGLPMGEYVEARGVKEAIDKEFQEFFESVDCEYKQISIKPLL